MKMESKIYVVEKNGKRSLCIMMEFGGVSYEAGHRFDDGGVVLRKLNTSEESKVLNMIGEIRNMEVKINALKKKYDKMRDKILMVICEEDED